MSSMLLLGAAAARGAVNQAFRYSLTVNTQMSRRPRVMWAGTVGGRARSWRSIWPWHRSRRGPRFRRPGHMPETNPQYLQCFSIPIFITCSLEVYAYLSMYICTMYTHSISDDADGVKNETSALHIMSSVWCVYRIHALPYHRLEAIFPTSHLLHCARSALPPRPCKITALFTTELVRL